MRHKATLSNDGTITLPPDIRRLLGVEVGDTIIFETSETGVHLSTQEEDDPFARYQGIARVGEGLALDQIIEEQREMRGYDEYDRQIADEYGRRD